VTPLELAGVARLAYEQAPTVEAGGVEVLEVLVDGDQGGAEAAIYGFRGTTFDGADILKDLRALPRRDPELGLIHRGFGDGVRRIWPVLHALLAVAAAEERSIHFCGHSKGGAEAAIAVGLALAEGYRVASLVTLGAPRPGFAGLARRLEASPTRILRYVRGRDAVPVHPWPLWGFRHPGAAIRIGRPRHRYRDHEIDGYIDELGRLTRSGRGGGRI